MYYIQKTPLIRANYVYVIYKIEHLWVASLAQRPSSGRMVVLEFKLKTSHFLLCFLSLFSHKKVHKNLLFYKNKSNCNLLLSSLIKIIE